MAQLSLAATPLEYSVCVLLVSEGFPTVNYFHQILPLETNAYVIPKVYFKVKLPEGD